MKMFLMLFVVFNSLASFAGVNIEIDNNNYSCEKKPGDLYHCESGDKKILVAKGPFGFSAYEKTSGSVPAIKWITKLTDDDKVIYEVPKMFTSGGLGMGMGIGMGGYTIPDTKSYRLMNANGIINNLKGFDDDWAASFVNDAKKYVEEASVLTSKKKIVSGGKEYVCNRGEDEKSAGAGAAYSGFGGTTIRCNFYACSNSGGEKVLSYIPDTGSYQSPYFINLKGEETELHAEDMQIFDNDKGEGLPAYNVPKFSGISPYPQGEALNDNLFVPAKFEKNKSAFHFFTNPYSGPMFEAVGKLCGGKNDVTNLLAEQAKLAEVFKNELATTKLSHYLTMTNGQMVSVLVDATKGQGLGCRYDDMILSPQAQAHLAYLQKAKPKPVEKFLTEAEVQDLFKKAKSMDDIPFGYKYDGCYARAHVMARRFEAMGIPTEKVWIKGSLFVPNTDIQWNYHVAPVINVKDKNGNIQKYVIDPSLNDKAVPVDEWVATMGKNVKGGVVKTSYPYPINVASFQRTAVAISSSDIYVPDNDEVRSEDENMQLAVQTMKEYTQVLKEKKNE
jgi:hypothetical protein